MAKGNPFGGNRAPPFGSGGKAAKAAFEKSSFDNDKGVKEGSKADKARDRKQMPAFLKSKKGK